MDNNVKKYIHPADFPEYRLIHISDRGSKSWMISEKALGLNLFYDYKPLPNNFLLARLR